MSTRERSIVDGPPRSQVASEVVARLVEHGVPDVLGILQYSTFGEHPVATNGAYSDIYRGHIAGKDGGEEVALKALRVTAQNFAKDVKHLKDAARELHTWSKCRHPNVLPLYGLAEFRGRIGMVSPWMHEGNLPDYLKSNSKANRIDICLKICQGLSHLHGTDIVHGDLKGANILISKDGNPVLADFGNSTLKDRTLKFTQATDNGQMTARWSAPERIYSAPPSRASDVYALGMTIYEVIAGWHPYHLFADVALVLLLAQKERWVPPGKFDSEPPKHQSESTLRALLDRCWSYDSCTRPSAIEVMDDMEKIPRSGVAFRVTQFATPGSGSN